MSDRKILVVLLSFCGVGLLIFALIPKLMRGGCIAKGSRIATPNGDVWIENVCVGDAVLTRGPTGNIETGVVVRRRELTVDSCLNLVLASGKRIAATAEHPFATPSGWRNAGALRAGDAIVTRDGVETLAEVSTLRASVQVYDLTVQPNPNFFANDILVHNKSRASPTAAAASLKAVAEAQAIYHRTDFDKDGVLEYSQSIRGLLETKPDASDLLLVDPSLGDASDGPVNGIPKAGYFFKMLTAQGSHAKGGKTSYIENGNMTRGFAVLAYPSVPDFTTAFMINHDGVIYQKDLKEGDREQVLNITEFDPDTSWVPTE